MKPTKIFLSFALIGALNLFAADLDENNAALDSVTIQEQNTLSKATKIETKKSIQDYFDDYAKEHEIEYGIAKEGKVFYSRSEAINANPSDPSFPKHVQIAYKKAMLALRSEYVKSLGATMATETIKDFYNDASDNAREFEDLDPGSRFNQILNKLGDLTVAQLDAALEKLGIDVQKGFQEKQKKQLLRDNIASKSLIKASRSMKGLVPIKTIVVLENTPEGPLAKIGIIAMSSIVTNSIANTVARQQYYKNTKCKGGISIKDALPETDEGYLTEYGIRLIFDEDCEPAIISYGNWGVSSKSASVSSADRKRQAATKQATIQADAEIIEFVKTQVNLQTNSDIGNEIEESIEKDLSSGNIEDKDINNITDIVLEKIRTSAKGSLRGIQTARIWRVVDENGLEHIGVVRVYSYKNIENIKKIEATEKAKSKTKTSTSSTKASKSSNLKNKQSKNVNNLDDF